MRMCLGGLDQSLLPSPGLLQKIHLRPGPDPGPSMNMQLLYIHQYIGKSNHLAAPKETVAHGDILAVGAHDKKRCDAHVSLELHLPKCSEPRSDCCLLLGLALLCQEGAFNLLLSRCCGSDVIQEVLCLMCAG